jgi:cation diffusion facilitator family transporter
MPATKMIVYRFLYMKNRERKIYEVTLIGSVVNVALLVFKFVAGIIGHSSAMIADAFHSLSDFLSDIIVIVFVRLAGKPEDSDHAYGHGKYETLASVIVGILLCAVGFGLLASGIDKIVGFFNGIPLEAPNYWALAAAALSIILKEALYRYTVIYGKKLDSAALIANAWHHRSDALTSIAALAGIGGAMLLGNKWTILDPLAATVVSLFIIKASYSLMKPGLDELLEKALPKNERDEIEEIISSTPGVIAYHRLRTRKVGPHRAIEMHVKMSPEISLMQAHEIATEVEKRIKKRFGVETHVGIHMEPFRG